MKFLIDNALSPLDNLKALTESLENGKHPDPSFFVMLP